MTRVRIALFALFAATATVRVDAELRDGVLSLKIPKSPEQQPKKVQVKSSSTPGGGGKTAKAGSA